MQKGFTLIELIVVIAIIGILSAIILFSVTQYINRGKDSNIAGNLAVLVPAGETYYNAYGNSYGDSSNSFCNPVQNGGSVLARALSQMPTQTTSAPCYAANPQGVCCAVSSDGQSWAACAREFTDSRYAYCVDSRGVKEEMCATGVYGCTSGITQCPDITQCQ